MTEDKLIALDEPYKIQFEFEAKYIDYRDGIAWAVGEEGEVPIPRQLASKDWEALGEVIDE